ncbi:MAG: peptidoglycan bridge formation protein FemAB, partial [Aeriscardovia sp.]|nr:peptidoglycan bridge formation protein FemAB [Aeriscardovia sp.]
MISAEEVTREELDEAAKEAGIALPIEQSTYWIRYQSHIEGRSQWRAHEGGGNLVFKNGDRVMAVGVFLEFETHGYRFLVCQHGPVWAGNYSVQDEENLAKVLSGFVK